MVFDPGDEGVKHVDHKLVVEEANYYYDCQESKENQVRDYFEAREAVIGRSLLLLLALVIPLGLHGFQPLGGANIARIQPILLIFRVKKTVFVVLVNVIK